ncbi:DUF4262 domain-containing protein [Hamadaea sp. NPDC050747]|uniref:DUF4262 domain-containing protein n=1 Tax=Hamadaea sp. NPDC050747 TaxID=3155789 RepID=UPI0033C425CA
MIKRECHCLLCQEPVEGNYWDARDRRTAECITEFGWSARGVHGDQQTPGWAYSIGLWHSLGSPEVSVFGLSSQTAMRIVNIVGDQIRDGHPLRPDQPRTDVVDGFDLGVRPAHPSWYRDFFGAALDFYQQPPLPIVQLVWPDRDGRFPWDAGADQELHQQQPKLWLAKKDHPRGIWADFDPIGGWPFGKTLPYHTVLATPAVIGGSVVTNVRRDEDGTWRFSDGSDGPWSETALRDLVTEHPEVTAVGDLTPGQRAVTADGTWHRY